MENVNEKINIPQGESLVDLNNRVITELGKIFKKHKKMNKDETIAIVCHGGTIRVILCNVLNLELKYMYRIEQYPTALNIIDYYDYKGFISLLNDTSHLEDWWKEGFVKGKESY